MHTRRIFLGGSLLAALPLSVRAQGTVAAQIGTSARPLRVGVTSGVHAQVLERVQSVVQAKGLMLKVTEFGDFIQPNAALAGGDLDANVYQHRPFLEQQIKDRGYKLAAVGPTVMTAMAMFSRTAKTPQDLASGARVAIPNDPTNGGRALVLLQEAGLLKLAKGGDFRSTVADIEENPKRLRIVELEAAQIARALGDVDAGVVTGNYAVAAGLDPLKDGLISEKPEGRLLAQYCCLVVVRQPDQTAPWAQALAAGYADPEVKEWVAKTFKGAVISGA